MRALWKYRTDLGLFGSHINVLNGEWVLPDCSIGGGVDSYFEYLLKVHVAFADDIEFGAWFQEAYRAVKMNMQRNSEYHDVHSLTGESLNSSFLSLGAFWQGVKIMAGDVFEGSVQSLQ
jgi:mannosidase alpha-like ER degradation enhancer 2